MQGNDRFKNWLIILLGGSIAFFPSQPVMGATPQPFDQWALALPEGVRGEADDPDADGLANVIEYAYGLDPLRPGRSGLPRISYNNGVATLSFTRPKSVVGVEYVARGSSQLISFEKRLNLVRVSETAETETLAATLSEPGAEGFAWTVLVRLVPPTLTGHGDAFRPPDADHILPYDIQAAFNNDTFFWHLSYPGNEGVRHDYFRFTNGGWHSEGGDRRDAQASLDQDEEQGEINLNSTIYEQRTSVMMSDPTAVSRVRDFGKFGCFLTCHNQSRHMPEWTDHAGEDTKYVHPAHVSDGASNSTKVLDLWHWRGARSGPIWKADDQYIAAKAFTNATSGDDGGRLGDAGNAVFQTQNLVDGHPQFVFNSTTTGGKFAFNWEDFWATPLSYVVQPDAAQLGPNAPNPVVLSWSNAVAAGYIPAEGDTLPRRILRAGSGSRADITSFGSRFLRETPETIFGHNVLGRWSVQMQRALDTGHDDDVALRPGSYYQVAFEVHLWEYTTRDHYVSFPTTLTLGPGGWIEAVDLRGPGATGPLPLPDWGNTNEFPVKRLYLFQPGINTWEFVSGANAGKPYRDPLTGNLINQVHAGAASVVAATRSCADCHAVRTVDMEEGQSGPMELLARRRGGTWTPTPVLVAP